MECEEESKPGEVNIDRRTIQNLYPACSHTLLTKFPRPLHQYPVITPERTPQHSPIHLALHQSQTPIFYQVIGCPVFREPPRNCRFYAQQWAGLEAGKVGPPALEISPSGPPELMLPPLASVLFGLTLIRVIRNSNSPSLAVLEEWMIPITGSLTRKYFRLLPQLTQVILRSLWGTPESWKVVTLREFGPFFHA